MNPFSIGLFFLSGLASAGAVADVHAKLASRVKDPELREMTERVLREMNTDYSALADLNLQARGEQFDHARLESTGVMAKDDTKDFDKTSFDQFVKPSFANRKNLSIADWMLQFVHPMRDAYMDVDDYLQAADGIMTKQAKKVLEPYKDKRIHEIVAHSWGSELIYAAILNGGIIPPKKLIVVGVPDDDFGKWEELARRTGTAVVWVRAQNDKAAATGAALLKSQKKVDFKAKWDAACANSTTRVKCNAFRRPPAVAVRIEPKQIPGLVGHGRKEYYDYLKEWHHMSGYADLRAEERAVRLAEVNVVQQTAFEAALREARGLVAKAREQAAIAKRDHEERLQNKIADLANRSCASPGSVVQADLDALPASLKEEYKAFTTLPRGLDSCSLSVYTAIGLGCDEAEILRLSVPKAAPVVASPLPTPVPVAKADPHPPFSNALPELSAFAAAACRSPESVSIEDFQNQIARAHFNYDYSNVPYDNMIAADLSARFDDCSKALFHRLIEMQRNMQVREMTSIDRQWIQNFTSYYLRAPLNPESNNGGNNRAPTGCIPGDNSRRNCIACGNRNC